jgi:Spy/CpxP family protein refolding chaperone
MALGKRLLVVLGLMAGGAAAMAALPGHREGRGLGRMGGELGLTPAQQEQIQAMRLDAERVMIRRRADMAIARLDLRQLMTAPSLDERALGAKVKELADLQAGMLRARVDQVLAFRKLLTPEQQQKLHALRPARPEGRGALEPGRRGPRDEFRPEGAHRAPIGEDREGTGRDADDADVAALTAR